VEPYEDARWGVVSDFKEDKELQQGHDRITGGRVTTPERITIDINAAHTLLLQLWTAWALNSRS
jgi:hypothetical protein